ncbi:MAG: DUF4157 domain-containing protein [Nostoc sp.]|uniref:eCIS core domain-containing protein n=1 Tax=Nostoc sp. TaxID=1180 RepID=UPI002FFBE87C
MHNKRLSKTPSSIFSNSQAAEQNPKLAYRPFGSQIQKASVAPVTQSTKEDVAFAEQKFEATGLELQAKYGKITPEGQERLTVLQAKMDGLLNSRLEHATRFGHNFANILLRRPDTATPIQAKLTIGEPGDKYEQEADETARQVVQRIHQPQSDKLQRESLPEEDELQMKPMVQRVSDGGMAASPDLEASINQARGGGQPLTDNIREPMEQAFGADFTRVKVHTDTQADQFNQSIQAKAFTTGQDVFFRQGEYEPGSRGGQELIAHELTHVVQQNQDLSDRQIETAHRKANALSSSITILNPKTEIQRTPDKTALNLNHEQKQKLDNMMCWTSVAYCLYYDGRIAAEPSGLDENSARQLLVGENDNLAVNPNIPANNVVGVFRREQQGGPLKLSHVMLSLGGNLCIGSNNGCIGGQANWSVSSLSELFDWPGNGGNPTLNLVPQNAPVWARERVIYYRAA